ncbi:exonuclease domain-containing protein [Nonomuraea sp. LP-02]|uniref:exonuclease domain-containing protein n=1 Tax=Nonomuraea sp. LP-02 TaxID=3097960 RepID=UPI002E3016FA|nr:exonuclease domain-containing protein [Nonomuraea sp. LP-02]MED7924582.1 exonuclease domain-containing protein [Nonomuraea sp. LP-02]
MLAGIPLLCTVKLARLAYPELPRHNLDALLRHLRIPRPADRHRALPDVLVTVAVLRAILRTGAEAGAWTTLRKPSASWNARR